MRPAIDRFHAHMEAAEKMTTDERRARRLAVAFGLARGPMPDPPKETDAQARERERREAWMN